MPHTKALMGLKTYSPANKTLWQGRKDSLSGERFFQNVDCVDVQKFSLNSSEKFAFLGFCSDEGIRRNEGRVGATLGPDKLREQLGKLAYHGRQSLMDLGNITCEKGELEQAQLEFSHLIDYCHQNQLKTVAIGGGHEIAWGHFMGLTPHYPKLGIINFDAHFDLRAIGENQLATSGTPFWQIHEICESEQLTFDYCCIGIQSLGNTKSLFDRADEWNVNYLTAEQFNTTNFAEHTAFLDNFLLRHEHIYLSICLDVFGESYAPGVSAPQALGLAPNDVMPLLKYILQTKKVVSIDMAELSPPLDHEQKTVRLAAAMIAELINYYG